MSALGELGNDTNRPTWAHSGTGRLRPEADGRLSMADRVEADLRRSRAEQPGSTRSAPHGGLLADRGPPHRERAGLRVRGGLGQHLRLGIQYTATATRCGNAVLNRHRAPTSRSRHLRLLGAVPNLRAAAFRQSATEVGVEGLAATVATSTTAQTTLAGLAFDGLDGIAPTGRGLLEPNHPDWT